jgi:hypothetical protein
MKNTVRWRTRTIGLGAALALAVGTILQAQSATEVAALRAQLRARYDIVKLQQGIALVPHSRTGNVRLIQIVDGVVTVDGETLTGRQLSDKLGRDAPFVVQASYLDSSAQRELVASEAPASAPPPPAAIAPSQDAATPRPQTRYGDIVRIGSSVTVSRDERVDGEVVAVLGSADIDGEVTRDVTVVLGTLTLGPNAVVRGDIALVGGRLDRASGATVFGKIDDVAFASFRGGPGPRVPLRARNLRAGPIGTVAGSITRIGLVVLLGLMAVALARGPVERIGERAAASPLRAGLVGLLAELLFVPLVVAVVVVLAVSIVGIPLLLLVPFGIGVVLLLMLLGFVGAAYQLGVFLTRRTAVVSGGAYLTFTIGVLAIAAVTLIARVLWATTGGFVGMPLLALGYLLEYLAWTVGFGAVILAWFNRRPAPPPPPTPSTASPAEV